MALHVLLFCTTCLMALEPSSGRADTRTWTGPAGGDWMNAGHWGGTVPTGSDAANINSAGPNVTTTTSGMGSLYVGRSGSGTLTVSNGGILGDTAGVLGQDAGSQGIATVTGAGATWTNSGTLYVGNNGTGTLNVSDSGSVTSASTLYVGYTGTGTLSVAQGGMVSNANGSVGNVAGSTGTATVSGAGSTWTNSGTLAVGNNGTGTLTVSESGSVTSASTLYVGYTGTGTLSVTQGGMVSNANGSVGNVAGSTGTATVSGAGSTWTNSGTLAVGNNGTGTMTVTNGGAVNNTTGYVGRLAGSTGNATVMGAGSSWSNSGDVNVGEQGTGTLSVLAGGTVSNTSGYVGRSAGSTGTASVSGSGSIWTNTADVSVGESGTGTLNVFAEGHVSSANGYVGRNVGSTGVARINRAGSTWANSGDLTVGDSGTGTLIVQEGANVEIGQALAIGHNTGAVGTMSIESTGQVHSAAGAIGNAGGTGSAVVTGDGSVWTLDTNLSLASSANPPDPAGRATLTLIDHGEVRLPGTVSMAGAALSQATLNIGAVEGSAAAEAGTLVAERIVFGRGEGEIVFNHTSADYVFSPDLTGSGTLTFLSGNTLLTGDLSGFTGSGSFVPGANMTTAAAQEASLSGLADTVNSAMIESRAIGQQLLGANRPLTLQSYGYAEALYGSAQGLVGGQYPVGDVVLMGGAAYGTQDSDGVEQEGATTLALAGRYMLGKGAMRPFVELGGWLTPNARLTLRRDYLVNTLPNDAAGETATGHGVADAQSWGGYGRIGTALLFAGRHQLLAYGEIGHQRVSYDGYTESDGPFPATVADAAMSFHVVRLGGSYTHDLGDLLPIRTALTLSGAAARSFGTESGMAAAIAGVGFTADAAEDRSWGEYGARLHLRATGDVSVSMGLTGTTAWETSDTALHGFIGVSYQF